MTSKTNPEPSLIVSVNSRLGNQNLGKEYAVTYNGIPICATTTDVNKAWQVLQRAIKNAALSADTIGLWDGDAGELRVYALSNKLLELLA